MMSTLLPCYDDRLMRALFIMFDESSAVRAPLVYAVDKPMLSLPMREMIICRKILTRRARGGEIARDIAVIDDDY